MKRTSRLRWQAAAIMTVAAFTVAACSSNSSSSSSPGSGSSSSSSNAALTASAPGITPTQITIGSHQPLTGPAAPGYSEIAPASAAYFAYVNAHGGVYGRKIVYKYLDDGYNPTTTASVVRQLVLQDNVYAIFNGLGTPTHLAAVSFLNAQKVPDVFVASGCDCWNDPKYPQTFGWQLDYVREGKILGQYVKQHFAGKKVAFFYQNDEFGLDGVKGLSYEIPASMVVSKQSYVPTNVNIAPQVAALRASGAQVVVSFSIPAFTALLKLNSPEARLQPDAGGQRRRLRPDYLVRAARGVREAGRRDRQRQPAHQRDHHRRLPPGAHAPATAGTPCSRWCTTSTSPRRRSTATSSTAWPSAYTFVQAMLKAGRNPTRAGLVTAIEGGLPQGPMVAPFAYAADDHLGATGAYMGIIQNGVIVQQGSVLTTDTSASGADHHLYGNRTAGAGEWHPVTLTPHRPSRTG